MADNFASFIDNVSAPARRATVVTPVDTDTVLDPLPKALIIGGAGNLKFRAVDSSADVTIPVSAGQIVPVRAVYVRLTGTTATNIVALS